MRKRTLAAWLVSLALAPVAGAQTPPPPPSPAPLTEEAPPAGRARPSSGLLPIMRTAFETPPVPHDGPPVAFDAKPWCGPPGRVWVSNEALLWWIEGSRLPPLVTTAAPGTPANRAGLLDQQTTRVLFGNQDVNDGLRGGWRSRFGTWLDHDQRLAVEAEFLILGSDAAAFNRASDGSVILARPFTNAATNNAAASLIAFPGVSAGRVSVEASTGNLVGAGVWLRETFFCDSDPCSTCRLCGPGGCGPEGCGSCAAPGDGRCGFRFDSLFGYRYLRLTDRLLVRTNRTALAELDGFPAGSNFAVLDDFYTTNDFNGVDLGLAGEVRRDNFFLNFLAKVAVGYNHASVRVRGYNANPNGSAAGGLLAQQTNITDQNRSEATAIPELGLKLGYQRGQFRVYAGYTFLYWYHLVRAAEQVDQAVDPAFVPGLGAPGQQIQPAFTFQDRNLWIQGVNLGVEWRY